MTAAVTAVMPVAVSMSVALIATVARMPRARQHDAGAQRRDGGDDQSQLRKSFHDGTAKADGVEDRPPTLGRKRWLNHSLVKMYGCEAAKPPWDMQHGFHRIKPAAAPGCSTAAVGPRARPQAERSRHARATTLWRAVRRRHHKP